MGEGWGRAGRDGIHKAKKLKNKHWRDNDRCPQHKAKEIHHQEKVLDEEMLEVGVRFSSFPELVRTGGYGAVHYQFLLHLC